MISKKISMKKARKSSFKNLIHYLCDPQNKAERVGKVKITNCISSDVTWAITEVQGIQSQNTRAISDKTYHLVVSFPEGESIDDVILEKIEAQFCEKLGFAEHQRISVVHKDTDNLHVHIAINKIHPIKLTLHEPYRDFKTRDVLCSHLEKTFFLQKDNHRSQKNLSQNKAQDYEVKNGVESLLTYTKRTCLLGITAANNWEEVHQLLASHGLEMRKKGNGLVIISTDNTAIKASSIDRNCSKAALEEKLGSFIAFNTQVDKKTYKPALIDKDKNTQTLYQVYQLAKESNFQKKRQEWRAIDNTYSKELRVLIRQAKLNHGALRFLTQGASRYQKRYLHATLNRRTAQKIEQLLKKKAEHNKPQIAKTKYPGFHAWLKEKAKSSDEAALLALQNKNDFKKKQENIHENERRSFVGKRNASGNGRQHRKPASTSVVYKPCYQRARGKTTITHINTVPVLSDGYVVHQSSRTQMLLQSDALPRLDEKRSSRNNRVRRDDEHLKSKNGIER